MNANKVRDTFLHFFESKSHQVVPSAPMVIKNDPTLMFTNAGMNQFKDIFLGHAPVKFPRVANSQKCLRVSGKHNDLEEVGHDTYHHTMFEMLGNWSFGDYFKAEAIAWAWELLTDVYQLDKKRLYVTVFEGSPEENLEFDQEAFNIWKKYIDPQRIIKGSKKDNFWEMGNTGPCGPCSEIHIDLRPESERVKKDALLLVNTGHPQVIEIWNLVFIQFNRKTDNSLEPLPHKHVDTGMGFERLCMALQGKTSNYDTDVFQPVIKAISNLCGIPYGSNEKTDIAMRVVADHLRTIAFAIADGQLPSNNKAGYVIRRILRRAVRYGYTFLGFSEPFICKLVDVLVQQMGQAYPELKAQQPFIEKVMNEEEQTFLRTLSTGIKLLDQIVEKTIQQKKHTVDGRVVFELYDTYGFPLDLTQLILREKGLEADQKGFDQAMSEQKNRSRSASAVETDDWIIISDEEGQEFIGYDYTEATVHITRYRKIKTKDHEYYQLVFDITPFYAESGGQTGDQGQLENDTEKLEIFDVKKENNLIVHLTKKLPQHPQMPYKAKVYPDRDSTRRNHSATHLLHYALRHILGKHVEQKGSLVEPARLRFDFSHFQKMTNEELEKVESMVNALILKNSPLNEYRNFPLADAQKMGAMALFGEKYGDMVRVIRFGDSVELCGGTHVSATGEIGMFKIISESAIAAGVRRIEAITGHHAEAYLRNELGLLNQIRSMFKNPKDLVKSIENLIAENETLSKKLEKSEKEKLITLCSELKSKIKNHTGINIIAEKIDIGSAAALKDLAFMMKNQADNLILILGAAIQNKPNITILISDNLVETGKYHAGNMIKEIAKEISGGGGGQAFFASAGGSDVAGLDRALSKALKMVGYV